MEKFRRRRVGLKKALLFPARRCRLRGRCFWKGDSFSPGQKADRFGKAECFLLHYESENASSLATAEAVKGLPLDIHRKGWILVTVKGAYSLEIAAAFLQGKIVGDHVVNGIRPPDIVEEIFRIKT